VTIKGLFHTLLTVLTWILFAYWWNKVIPQISVEVTLLWVRYNIGIFRRKGPRKNLPSVSEEREADYLGRRLDHPGYDFLKDAPLVVVSREEDRKNFNVPLGV
jgi:hypothetical protein